MSYIIEHDGTFWRGPSISGQPQWTDDKGDAVRFFRLEDAERVRVGMGFLASRSVDGPPVYRDRELD